MCGTLRDRLRKLFIHNFEAFRIFVAIVIAFAVIAVLVLLTSDDAAAVSYWFILGPLTSVRRFGGVVELAIPFVLCGLSVTMMFQVNKFNLCSDGIFYIGMAFATIFALNMDLPPVVLPIVIMVICGIIGGAVAMIPASLNVRFNANVVVCALMLNYVLQYLGRYILLYVVKDPALTYNGSPQFPDAAILHNLIRGTRIHTGIIVAILAVLLIYWLLKATKLGFAIRVTGQNASFAKATGINVTATILIAQFIGGALAGVGGAVEVMGIYKQFRIDTLLGYGFDGLLLAVLGKNHPIKVTVAAVALAYLRQGAALVNSYTDIPLELVQVLQGMVVIFVAAEQLMAALKHRMIVKDSEIEGGITHV